VLEWGLELAEDDLLGISSFSSRTFGKPVSEAALLVGPGDCVDDVHHPADLVQARGEGKRSP